MAPDDGAAWPGRAEQQSRRLIERYQEVAQVSGDMLAAAHREDWEEVARLGARCRILIGQLKRAALSEALSEAEQERRLKLLREILQDDAQIRMRSEPWLLELERLIGMTPGAGPSD
ncbi:MAG TPA: flagellar protein FliT [Burkholderiaceae bacterium]|jgi:flagellar protein FliT|nr:flagellar protein FliT [Burkholderiaceae bacterium]